MRSLARELRRWAIDAAKAGRTEDLVGVAIVVEPVDAGATKGTVSDLAAPPAKSQISRVLVSCSVRFASHPLPTGSGCVSGPGIRVSQHRDNARGAVGVAFVDASCPGRARRPGHANIASSGMSGSALPSGGV